MHAARQLVDLPLPPDALRAARPAHSPALLAAYGSFMSTPPTPLQQAALDAELSPDSIEMLVVRDVPAGLLWLLPLCGVCVLA